MPGAGFRKSGGKEMKALVSNEATNRMSNGMQRTAREEAIQRDHEEVLKSYAVEQYLFNELPEEKRTRFEEHYFECAGCADAVEAGQAFIKYVGQAVRVPARVVWWRQPAAAIAALFLGIAGGQQVVIAILRAPHANSVILARQLEKGEAEKAYTLRTASATIEVNLPAAAGFPFYLVKIAGGQNRELSQVVPAPGKEAEQRLSVQVSPGALGAGHFTVDVAGLDRADSKAGPPVGEMYEFDLKRGDK
jgi:hypothetical protein